MNSLCYIDTPGRSKTTLLCSGIILSCKHTITSSAASFAESTISDYVGSRGRCMTWGYWCFKVKTRIVPYLSYRVSNIIGENLNFAVQFYETTLTTHIRENKTVSIQKHQNRKEVYIWLAGTKLTLLNKILEGSVACLSCLLHYYTMSSFCEVNPCLSPWIQVTC